MTSSPCFVNCGKPACKTLGCVRVYNDTEDAWTLTYEKATPLYIGPLPHYARRMLQALDAYWLHCDGLPKGRYPRSRSTAEDWWGRFEKYRSLVEGQL